MATLLDLLSQNEISYLYDKITRNEKGGIKREASLHRWWSRRSIYMYRAILSAFLLQDQEKFFESLDNPYLLDAKGMVYLEPMAGGGTGIVEASMFNYTSYGIDINPLAIEIIHGYPIIRKGVTTDNMLGVIEKVKEKTKWLWNDASYILITRGKTPSWIYSRRKRKVILCPYCGTSFETDRTDSVSCPSCGHGIEITVKPIYEPSQAVDYFKNWKAFGIIKYDRTFTFDERWLTERKEKLKDFKMEIMNIPLERIKEGNRLLKHHINRPEEVFTPAQLYTYHILSEEAKSLTDDERDLLMLASSDSAKSCSILSRWYPPLTEPVIYGGGVKGFWVPEYTVETNPIASIGKTPKARGNVISGLRNQERIRKFKFRGEIHAIHGDTLSIEYPKSSLILIDPPYYGFNIDYTSLSMPHSVVASMFKKLDGFEASLENEIKRKNFFSSLKVILEKSKNALRENGRIVLVLNFNDDKSWGKLKATIEETKLSLINSFRLIGESPGELGRSKNKTNTIFVLSSH